MKSSLSRLAWLSLVLTLAACGRDERAAPLAAAGGEVQEGTISDAMLPLDTVRSQPPLAPEPEAPLASAAATGRPEDGAGAPDRAVAEVDDQTAEQE